MAEDRTLPYGQPLPASWLAAIQEFIGTAAVNFHLSIVPPGGGGGATAVQVVAGANSGQVGIGIDGLFRYVSATVSAAVTGGPGGRDIFAVTGPNDFVPNPGGDPPENDLTDYSFALQVLPTGTTPTTSSTVTNWRKVGELDWDGTQIVGFRPLVGDLDVRRPLTPTAGAPAIVPIRAIGAAGQSANLQTWESSAGVIEGRIDASGNLTVTGTLSAGALSTTGALTVGSAVVVGATHLEGTLTLDAALAGASATFSSTLQAQSITTTGDLSVGGNAAVTGNLTVTGTMTTGGQAMANIVPPVGAVIAYTGQGDPPGGQWLIADGRLIDSSTYAAFDGTCGRTAPTAMQHAYNNGTDPLNNKVRIPDKRGKKSIGAINMGTTVGSSGNAYFQGSGGARSGKPGDSGGEVAHTVSMAEMPSHSHNSAGVLTGGGGGVVTTTSTDHTHSSYFNTGGVSAWHTHTTYMSVGDQHSVNLYTSGGSWTAPGTTYTGYGSGNPSGDHSHLVSGGTNWQSAGYSNYQHNHGIYVSGQDAAHNNMDPYQADSYIVRVL